MAAASIKDVARVAGVSLGTVSNVLNRPQLVRPETRTRVEEAILRLGYVRNDSARQLRAGVSRTIGFVALDAANPFFTDVLRGMDAVAREEGLIVYLCDSNQNSGRERDYLEQLLQQRVRGVCIAPVGNDEIRLRMLTERGIPVVLVDRGRGAVSGSWCSVGVDDVLGGELAVGHLISLGHKRIGYVGTTENGSQSMRRLTGARRAETAAGEGRLVTVIPTTGMAVADGRVAGARLIEMAAGPRPTAVFCGNDVVALGLLEEMNRHGIRVPDDLAIVGYDDIDLAASAAVPLTSVLQPRHLLGRTAAELLLDEAESGGSHRHRQVQYTPELVVRDSSGPPRPGLSEPPHPIGT